jgi:hypothetical protein
MDTVNETVNIQKPGTAMPPKGKTQSNFYHTQQLQDLH